MLVRFRTILRVGRRGNKMKALLVIIFAGLLAVTAFSQQFNYLRGKVTENNIPVAGATVTVISEKYKDTKYSTTTNEAGEYELAPPPGDYQLSASFANNARSGVSPTISITITEKGEHIQDLQITTSQPIREFVTISADAKQAVDEVSKTVDVIGGQQMRDRADITLADSLRAIPGFRVQQLGGFGRTASIKSRGLRNQDTAVLLDGMRLRDASSITGDASPFLSDLTLTSVSRVEVLRGPGSSLYGTNSIGGTIDLQTPLPQAGWHGQLSGAAGGLGMGRFRGNVSKGSSSSRFGFNAALSRTVYTKGIDGDDDANNTNFQSRIEMNPTASTNLSFRFFYSDAFAALNSNPDTFGSLPITNSGIIDARPNVNFVADANDPDNSQRSKFLNGQFVVTQTLGSSLMLQGSYSGLTTSRKNDSGPLGVGFQNTSTSLFEGTINTLNGHLVWTPASGHRFTTGYEFEREKFRNEGSTPSGTEDFFTDAAQSSNAVYAQHLLSFDDGRLQFGGGIRAQFFRLGSAGFSLTNPPYSNLSLADPPSAVTFDGSASYYISRSGTKLRTHAGSGYRVPSLYERFGSFFNTFPTNSFVALGDPRLKPERSAAFDAGVDQYLAGRKITLSAVYFYTKLIDTIGYGFAVPKIGTTVRPYGGYLNTKGGSANGVELSGSLRPTSSTEIFASYTNTNSRQREPQVAGSGVLRTLGIPKDQFTVTATQRFGRFWINADLLATSSYLAPVTDSQTFTTYVYRFDGNRRIDLTAGYTFRLGEGRSLRVFGTVENLLDAEYFENGFRTAGQNARVGVNFGF